MSKELKTLLGIVKSYLKQNGFDGLYSPAECACELDDLMPCDEPRPNCKPGYKVACRCGEECEWDIAGEPDA